MPLQYAQLTDTGDYTQLTFSGGNSGVLELDFGEFVWNKHTCSGTPLHRAALTGRDVTRILDEDASLLDVPFHFSMMHEGIPVECTGHALHLAASRGFVPVVRALLQRGACVHACVARGDQNLYQVLHAACYAEGRGGTPEMVRFLLEANARIEADHTGRSPLHYVFQTGKPMLIPLLKNEMEKTGEPRLFERELEKPDGLGKTPLHLAIEGMRMTIEEMAELAAPTMRSLQTFIKHEPECIPEFLERVQDIAPDDFLAQDVAAAVMHTNSLLDVLDQHPVSAAALLNASTGEPECGNSGWNPLPKRVTLNRSGIHNQCVMWLNGPASQHCAYIADDEWKYDSTKFRAPDWQAQFTGKGQQGVKKYTDVCIRVCFIPDFICAEFFTALVGSGNEDIFDDEIICGTVEYLWWRSAYRSDLVQLFVTVWALMLLIVEMNMDYSHDVAVERELRPANKVSVSHGHSEFVGLSPLPLSAAFLGARGFTDLMLELIQIFGLLRIGRGRDYLAFGNAWDISRCLTHIMFYLNTECELSRIGVVFFTWLRLLEIFTFSKIIADGILPIVYSFNGVGPSVVVTGVCFFGFLQAFYAIDSRNRLLEEIVFDNFNTLITAGLPSSLDNVSSIELFVNYFAVCVFTLFMLNIFITVIGESYNMQKERVTTAMRILRAARSQVYLVRTKIIPGNLVPRKIANVATALVMLIALLLQAQAVYWKQVPSHTVLQIWACQAIMVLMAHQEPKAPWSQCFRSAEDEKMYMWIAVKQGETQASSANHRLEDVVEFTAAAWDPDIQSPTHGWQVLL